MNFYEIICVDQALAYDFSGKDMYLGNPEDLVALSTAITFTQKMKFIQT